MHLDKAYTLSSTVLTVFLRFNVSLPALVKIKGNVSRMFHTFLTDPSSTEKVVHKCTQLPETTIKS